MADISKIKLPSGTSYDVKDTTARNNTAMNLSSIGMSKKNLLKLSANTQTINGITFTVNDDKSVTVTGTATDSTIQTTLIIANSSTLKNTIKSGRYILSGCPSSGGSSTYRIFAYHINPTTNIADDGNGVTGDFDYSNITDSNIAIVIAKGYTDNINLTFYPMLRYADITDDTYEIYTDDLQTQIQNNDTELRDMLALSTKPVKTVYVDGTNGSDDNDGSTKAKAFKTLEKAIKLLLECNSLIVYLASGTYDITSDGYIGTSTNSYLRNKTLYLSNTDKTKISDVIVRGCIKVMYNTVFLCSYITLESYESSSWATNYDDSMFYIGECAQVYITNCIINNTYYESTFAILSSNATFINITINNTSGKTNRHGFRVAYSTIFINSLTDNTSTADIYNMQPCFITSNRTLTERGTRGGLLVVNGEIQQ